VIHAAEQDRPDVAERRSSWRLMQAGLDPRRLVFIDETWCKTNMTRLRGRAPVGQRLEQKIPHSHWKTTTLIGALDLGGMRCAMTVDGPIDGASFTEFVRQVLAPTLKPGQVVVMDNLSCHKGMEVRELIESCGAELWFLPPYSPDLSPIENAFSKLRKLFQGAEHRSIKALWEGTQQLLAAVSESDARGFFRHCGYAYAT
jgi:transposase